MNASTASWLATAAEATHIKLTDLPEYAGRVRDDVAITGWIRVTVGVSLRSAPSKNQ